MNTISFSSLTVEKRQEFLWQLQKDSALQQTNLIAFLRDEHDIETSIKMADIQLASLQNISRLTSIIAEDCIQNPSFNDAGLEICARLEKIKVIPQNSYDLLAKDISILNSQKVDVVRNSGVGVAVMASISTMASKFFSLDMIQSIGAGVVTAGAVFLIKPAIKVAKVTSKAFQKSSATVCRHIEKNVAARTKPRELRSKQRQLGFTLV